jgi:excisionase family DNA binding protein
MKQKTTRIPKASRALYRRVLDERWDGRSTFSVEEAGEIVGLSRASAYNAAKSGELPTVRFGKRLIVPRGLLEELLCPS